MAFLPCCHLLSITWFTSLQNWGAPQPSSCGSNVSLTCRCYKVNFKVHMLTAFGGKLGEVIRIRGGYQNAASMVALVAL